MSARNNIYVDVGGKEAAGCVVMQENLSERITRLRVERKWSAGELAVEIRSTAGASQVRYWESNGAPSAKWIPVLAAALGVTCDYLLTGKESLAERRDAESAITTGA